MLSVWLTLAAIAQNAKQARNLSGHRRIKMQTTKENVYQDVVVWRIADQSN
jgi:hypothetical protein